MTDYLTPGPAKVQYTVAPQGKLLPYNREGYLDMDMTQKSIEASKGYKMTYGKNYLRFAAQDLYNLWLVGPVSAGDILFRLRLKAANEHFIRVTVTAYTATNYDINVIIEDLTENQILFQQAIMIKNLLEWSINHGTGKICMGFAFYKFAALDPTPNYMSGWCVWDSLMNSGYANDQHDQTFVIWSNWYAEYPSTGNTLLRYQVFNYADSGEDNPEMPPPSEPKADEGINAYTDYNIDFPDAPAVTAVSTDLLRLYRIDSAAVTALAAFLWSDNFIQNIKKLYASPMDNIISLNILPVNISSVTTSNIVIGNLDTGIAAYKLSGQFLTMDFHSVQIPKMWGNQLDFQPATTCQIFIPYIGYRDIDLDDASGGTVSLKMRLDLLSGDLLAMVKVTQEDRYYHDSVEYFFDGNCAVNIPLSGANYGQMYAAYVGTGLGFATSALMGNVPGMMASAAGGVSSIMTGKPAYQRSGSIGGARGYMGLQQAFILLSSPVPSIPGSITQIRGLRSNIYSQFSQLSGYTEIEEFLPNSTLVSVCTEEELQEIKNKLKEGVIF